MGDHGAKGREKGSLDLSLDRPISRRECFKLAGLAGATVAVGGGLGGLLAGCSDSSSTTTTAAGGAGAAVGASSSTLPAGTTPTAGGVLKQLNTSGNWTNLGLPFDGLGITEYNGSCLETLLGLDRQGNVFPWLAESYAVADDKTSITFSLRKGVKFHDGSDFNAEAVKWNLEQFMTPGGGLPTGAPPAGAPGGTLPEGPPPEGAPGGTLPEGPPPAGAPAPPAGAPPTSEGAPPAVAPPASAPAGGLPAGGPPSGGAPGGSGRPWASIDVVDEYTVRVNLTEWQNNLPISFTPSASPAPAMISKAAFDKNGLDWMRWNPVGTGPFKFESYSADVGVKFVKNPDFWYSDAQGIQLPYLDGLETVFTGDETSMLVLAKSGEGDTLRIALGKQARDYSEIGFNIEPALNSVDVLLPDSANADSVWADQKVREAAEYAIDRETIAKNLGYGYWEVPYQIPPPDSMAHNPDFPLARMYDPEKAKQLLAEAGHPDGFKTAIIVSAIGGNRDVAVALQAYLAGVGIQAELEFPDLGKWVTYTGATGAWHNAAILTPCISQEPTFIEGIQFMENMWGNSWLRTPDLKQAYQAALASPTMDPALARAVTDVVTRDALAIPIYTSGNGSAYRPYVVPNFAERGIGPQMNYMDWWLNK